MASKFKGRNSIKSSIKLYYERSNFHLNAYNDFEISNSLRDLTFGEFQMYGRVDTNMLPVVPKEDFLVSVSAPQAQEEAVRVFDFVLEAFQNVQSAFRNACLLNKVPQDDPYLSVINAVKGYESPVDLYSQYMEDMLKVYAETYIVAQNRRANIITINDYMSELVNYLKVLTSTLPLTFSSWQKTNKSSIFTSGLAISIADLSIDNDTVKDVNFLSNPAFQYYLNVCKQNGFNVSKNSPWVIFADIDSQVMKQNHLAQRLITSPASLFANRFDDAYTLDIQLLEEVITRNYNKFVLFYPIEKKYSTCNNNKLIYNIINRNNINSITESVKQSRIISIYANMKNIEENYIFRKADLNILIKNANNFAIRFDIQRAMGYINERFRQTFKSKNGGINSIIRSNKNYENRRGG